MLIGVDQTSDEEKIEIRRPDNPKVVQFFMKMYFGVQFESISPEVFMAGGFNYVGDPAITATPEDLVMADTAALATSTKTVVIEGENLTGALELAVQGAGFTLDAYSITEAQAEAVGGKTITVTFSPTEA